jgi:uncharacterized damage-inducible protein DinB
MRDRRPNSGSSQAHGGYDGATVTRSEALREMISYSTWSTLQLIDHCLTLDAHVLEKSIPSASGTIPTMLEHMLDQSRRGLGELGFAVKLAPAGGLDAIRARFEEEGRAWESVADKLEALDAEPRKLASIGAVIPSFATMYMLQTLHHLEVHRTQIRATLDSLGHPVPGVDSTDVWAYWVDRHDAVLPG